MGEPVVQEQLPLRVSLRDEATLENYHGEHNRQGLARVRQILAAPEPAVTVLCGGSGAGKSHLLNALCLAAEAQGDSALCLSLSEAQHLPAEALLGLEQFRLVCLDDLQALPADPAWEEALFHLHNRVLDAGGQLWIGAPAPPATMHWQLPDLASRLKAAAVIQLRSPEDDDLLHLLQARAASRGLELAEEVGRYVLRRAPRDTGSLLELLAQLDDASLRNQRRLTIPFVKTVMAW
ncbi:MAG: DnaA regulatory inactivator Hda [Halomonadaceae bacterium]|nr:MAG: DnaA regulatory inactivator Hda [Halomonadaceae bacterium]